MSNPESQSTLSSRWSARYSQCVTTCSFPNPKGSTLCYRNAITALLLHTPILLDWVENYQCQDQNCAPENRCFLCGLRVLSHAYWHGGHHADLLQYLWVNMLKKGWVVVGGEPVTDTQEQDAPEFLDHFIEVLDQQAQALKYPMPDIFGIKLRKNYVCTDSKCMHVTPQAGERPNALMCRIPHPFDQGLAIEDLIRDTLVEDSQMTCDKCENPVVLRSTVDNPPDILFVQITRASYTKTPKGFKAQKITRQVIFDDELIIALGGGQPTRYELYGVVNHQGKIIQRGHYLTVVKGPTGQWAEVNDNQEPKGVNFDTLQSIAIRQNATLLAYRKLAADEVVARVTVATEPRGAKRKKAVDDEGQEEAPPAKSRKPVGEEEKSRWKLLYRVKRLSKWKKDPSPASNREQHRSIRQCIKDIFSSNPSITLVEADEAISEEYYDEEADVLVRPTRKPAKPKGAAKKAKTKAGKKGKK